MLEIQVVPLSAFRQDAPRAAHLFRHVDRETFSAVTVFNGPERMIVYNDAHSRGRQASDIDLPGFFGPLITGERRSSVAR